MRFLLLKVPLTVKIINLNSCFQCAFLVGKVTLLIMSCLKGLEYYLAKCSGAKCDGIIVDVDVFYGLTIFFTLCLPLAILNANIFYIILHEL